MRAIELDLLQTLSLAGVVYFAGVQGVRRLPWLARLNIPAAVVGGLSFTALALAPHGRVLDITLNTALQSTLSVAFFTTIGMGASLGLLRAGGVQVPLFLAFSTVFAVVQNALGMAIARAFGENPLLGVMAGSVTLVGGPATGMAFAPVFEDAGLAGAGTIAITAATIGIVCGGLVGGPVGTRLIERHGLGSGSTSAPTPASAPPDDETLVVAVAEDDNGLVRNLVIMAVAMGLGSLVSLGIQSLGATLPAYVGAMLVAAVLRNVDDATGWLGIDQRTMDFVGNLALNLFLVVALMGLEPWKIAGLALPLLAILVAQVVAVVLVAGTASFWLMGRDYDAAVMASGFVGFVLGTTANAVANMRALVARFGPARRAFIVVPIVGAFFIDFTNALIITGFLNWSR